MQKLNEYLDEVERSELRHHWSGACPTCGLRQDTTSTLLSLLRAAVEVVETQRDARVVWQTYSEWTANQPRSIAAYEAFDAKVAELLGGNTDAK